MAPYQRIKGDFVPIKAWVKGVPLEDQAIQQLRNVAALPFIHKWVAAMPDVHWGFVEDIVHCHHNYVAKEHHYDADVWVTRKGAVRAREGDMGIIPGSMGARSYIVRGKGNPESFHSCSHGAGRQMSRGKARTTFSLEDHAKATEGIECRKDVGVLDETPGAYKSIDAVMAAQSDLVKIVHTLRQSSRVSLLTGYSAS